MGAWDAGEPRASPGPPVTVLGAGRPGCSCCRYTSGCLGPATLTGDPALGLATARVLAWGHGRGVLPRTLEADGVGDAARLPEQCRVPIGVLPLTTDGLRVVALLSFTCYGSSRVLRRALSRGAIGSPGSRRRGLSSGGGKQGRRCEEEAAACLQGARWGVSGGRVAGWV